ncbi:MAG TPA: head GIN domain-containing protein [Blastocatellia bacterium]|nr:head GIN domain-containing protein [Blastocatellia bacterium]
MKPFLVLSLCLLVLSVAGCKSMLGINKVQGSGTAKTEKRDVARFTAIEVQCHGVVNVTAQAPASLSISGDDNIVPLITTEVRNGTLYIKSDKDYDTKSQLKIDVTTPDIEKFAFTGAGEVALSKLRNEHVEISLSGAGRLTASGEAKEADIALTGAGDLDAKDLHTVKTSVKSTGAGSVDVYATDELVASATGVGNVNYYGNPKQVKTQATGLGSIDRK